MTPPRHAAGAFRRRIRIHSPAETRAVAELEDDFHRFRVSLEHDGRQVVACEGEAVRYPWSECPGAAEPIRSLAGTPLSPRGTSIAAYADPHANCTHLFDLAGLAVAHAAAGRDHRLYDAVVPDRDEHQRTHAQLFRDGELVLAWDLEGVEIRSPVLYEGVRLRGGFLTWVDARLDPETAEAATVLRRACDIAWGRGTPWDELDTAVEVGEFMLGVCHTFQPGRAEVAVRMRGSIRDFSDRPDDLLAG